MTTYIKKNQKLPDEIKRHFDSFASNLERDQLISELVDAGWTYEAISAAANITRERVRQIYGFEPAEGDEPIPTVPLNIQIPVPPTKPERSAPKYIEPDPKSLERLLELQPYAQQVRSNGKKYREEAEEYTKLLNHVHTVEGVTLYRLAKRLGVTHGALRFRLVRYGYKKPVTATSKVYTPIVKENRL
jgi:hypothetical protein